MCVIGLLVTRRKPAAVPVAVGGGWATAAGHAPGAGMGIGTDGIMGCCSCRGVVGCCGPRLGLCRGLWRGHLPSSVSRFLATAFGEWGTLVAGLAGEWPCTGGSQAGVSSPDPSPDPSLDPSPRMPLAHMVRSRATRSRSRPSPRRTIVCACACFCACSACSCASSRDDDPHRSEGSIRLATDGVTVESATRSRVALVVTAVKPRSSPVLASCSGSMCTWFLKATKCLV